MKVIMNKLSFGQAKKEFNEKYSNKSEYNIIVPRHLTMHKKINWIAKDGSMNEQYYKWQFIYALIHSGWCTKDYIGTEVRFPKGNKNSNPIIMDACVFSDKRWFKYYSKYWNDNDLSALDWLRSKLVLVLEAKKDDGKDLRTIWDQQLKAYMKESDREYCLGVLYDMERMYIFKKENGKYIRFSEELNTKGVNSKSGDLSLDIPDPYKNLPSFLEIVNGMVSIQKHPETIDDLSIISGVHSFKIGLAMSAILKAMDKQSLFNQRGYELLVKILTLKISDERANQESANKTKLRFYITKDESTFSSLDDKNIQSFIKRISELKQLAADRYRVIFNEDLTPIDLKDKNVVKFLVEVVKQFQNYSFIKSEKTDLYQLVFYQFAGEFSKHQNAQFITPLPLINFLVKIINPQADEQIIDPTCGIADFLSVAYVNSKSKFNDQNLYGMDIDPQMVMLATLNMLLNGDGNSKIVTGNALWDKFSIGGEGETLKLLADDKNKNGNWNNRNDNKTLKQFDVVLTNPPFGDDRAFVPENDREEKLAEDYVLWNKYNENTKKQNKKIDMGILFLENAYHLLKPNGRFGIVLSNSIASIDAHKIAREELMKKMRIVALFDMPANVFAETGVNTTIIIAYKPTTERLKELQKQDYNVFTKSINKVGYEVLTKKRVKVFSPVFKIDQDTFKTKINEDGEAILDEDFSSTIKEFRDWCEDQEEELKQAFLND